MSSHILGNSPFDSDLLASRYEIKQQLAKKAGRRTLLARDLENQELVVIKILSFDNDFEWDALKLFEREAETLKALSHPAIPRYLDFFELEATHNRGFALVQTYVEGKSLEAYLQAGRTFDEADAKELAASLLEILSYLHGRQPPVIHRDIKPSNILLGDRTGNSIGQVYLVDFGSVQTLAAIAGGTMTIVGTYGYMPPEQFGDRTLPASDLYSLGATLIYLVTGTHPADLPHKDGSIQFEQIALSPTFANWLRWMTQPSLDRRLTSASAALQALSQPQLTNITSAILKQPAGSKVVVNKNADAVEVLLPPKGFSSDVACLVLFTSLYNFVLIPLTLVAWLTPFGVGTVTLALFLACFWVGDYYLFMWILSPLFGRIRLSIEPRQLVLTHEIFGRKYKRSRRIQKQDITALKLLYGYLGNRQFMEIWAGKIICRLWSDSELSEPELEWLAGEIGSWLDLPVTREPSFYIPKADKGLGGD